MRRVASSFAAVPLLLLCLGAELHAGDMASASAATVKAPSWWDGDDATGNWGGRRTALADRGVVFNFNYTADGFGVVAGGIKRGVFYNGLLDLGVDLDLEKLLGWKGGHFHVNAIDPHGANGSAKYVGDIGDFSNIDAYDSYRLYELWLEQSFLDDRFSLRAGQITFDSEFAILGTYGGVFIQSSFGTPGAIGANLPMPIYPIAGPGVRLRIRPAEGFVIQAAVYDGNGAPGMLPDPSPNAAPSNEFNHHGTEWALRPDEGALIATEISYRCNQPPEEERSTANTGADDQSSGKSTAAEKPARGRAGSYKVGFLYHTDDFADIHDVTLAKLGSSLARAGPRSRGADYAIYASIEEELWREPQSETQGLGAFAQVTWMPPDRNLVELSIESGLNYLGAIPGRDKDALGLGIAYLKISDQVADAVREVNRHDRMSLREPEYEATLELVYRCQVAPWLSIQPHAQYIIQPGGTREHENAVILGVRVTMAF